MASSVKSVFAKNELETLGESAELFSGELRVDILETEGSERRALHHSCRVKSSRCSI